MIGALVRPCVARLTRTPRALVASAGWTVLALGFAAAARSGGAARGADHVLVGAFGALVLPLLAYVLVGALVAGGSLAGSTRPVVAFGAPPARAAAVTVAVALAVCVAAGGILAAAVALVAHGPGDPPAARDAIASAGVGALGGGAYGALFALGASIGRRGGARTLLLALDYLLGAGSGAPALLFPRAHVRSLLGGAAPLDWPGRASSVALAVLVVVFAAIAVWRSRSTAR